AFLPAFGRGRQECLPHRGGGCYANCGANSIAAVLAPWGGLSPQRCVWVGTAPPTDSSSSLPIQQRHLADVVLGDLAGDFARSQEQTHRFVEADHTFVADAVQVLVD